MGQRGITLIELGVVLAVLSIIATITLPNYAEIARNQLAKKAAIQLEDVVERAKLYYHDAAVDTAVGTDPVNMNNFLVGNWPDDDDINCVADGGAPDAIAVLALHGGIPDATVRTNMWGNNLLVSYEDAKAGGPLTAGLTQFADWGCNLVISTEVPDTVAGVIQTYIPLADCGGPPTCGPPDHPSALGNTRCCVRVPKPSLEPSMINTVCITRVKSGPGVTGGDSLCPVDDLGI